MPKHKDDEKPEELTNPATSAHLPADESKPKPAPKMDTASVDHEEKPAPKAKAVKADEPEAPAPERRTIEELLADPHFDPDGKVRARLAEISARDGVGQYAPADLVDDHGNVVG